MKNIRHKKTLAISCISLAAVATAGIGYASWVISSQSQEASVDNIQVTADDIQDNRISLTNYGAGGYSSDTENKDNTSVCFGASQIDNSGDIQATGKTEDMTFAIHFTVGIPESSTFNGTVEAELSGNEGWKTEYIVSPITGKTALVNITNGKAEAGTGIDNVEVKLDSGTAYTFEAIFTFKWGSFFEYKNPSTSDNWYSSVGVQKGVDALKAVYGYATDSLTVKLSVSTKAK